LGGSDGAGGRGVGSIRAMERKYRDSGLGARLTQGKREKTSNGTRGQRGWCGEVVADWWKMGWTGDFQKTTLARKREKKRFETPDSVGNSLPGRERNSFAQMRGDLS